jgi:hypothetical protein
MAKAATKTKAPEKAKPNPARALALSAVDFHYAETVVARFVAQVPPGTKREEVLDKTYWRHCASQIPSMSEIVVIPKDGSWYGRYFVRYADKVMASLHELEWHEMKVILADEIDDKKFSVDFTTGENFRVIRLADMEVISKGHNSFEDANEWLVNHSRAVAA